MKIQSLAVMFIILILPISVILGTYTQNRVETLSLQTQYDSKLKDATYDALKSYQLNSFNSDTSDYTNSKMRDIKASVNTFFNSLGTNFSTIGYSKETLQSYVPAVVYTMYDGYYIYSPYTNTWDGETNAKHQNDASYKNGESLYGLKPYVYYSCRYKSGNLDIVITYSLDNYIAIQGKNGDTAISKYGYLLSNVNGDDVSYNGIKIDKEKTIEEQVCVNDVVASYPCIRKNGTKYYKNGNEIFTVINGKKISQPNINSDEFTSNDYAIQYYKEAKDLKDFIKNNLNDLKVSDAVDIDGKKFTDENPSPYQNINEKIFDYDNPNGIEASDSNFNTHRFDVIKYSIEKNLSVAISNYNNYSSETSANFKMPKLKDTDWEKIMDNISIISFLQGVSIGGKIYNGYSVITNNKNQDVVMEDSIYIQTNDNILHRFTEEGLNSKISPSSSGIFNVNAERRTGGNNTLKYYYPIYGELSYDSIITQNKINNKYSALKDYLSENKNLAKVYYTALARERYSMYREKLDLNI